MSCSEFFKWESCGLTDKGKRRSHNEDACLDQGEQGLWVVADGAGGHQSGEVASGMIIEGLQSLELADFLGQAAEQIKQRLDEVNSQLVELSGGEDSDDIIGSTVTVLLQRRYHYVCLWAGDSRLYLFRDNALSLLSRDHNRVDEFIISGMSAEEAEGFAYAQQLNNAVGMAKPLHLETQVQEVKVNDVFLLCSDGLTKEITDQEIEQFLQQQTQQSIKDNTQALMEMCLERGARDNVTVMLVKACAP